MVFHYGHSSPGPNLKLYNAVVSAINDKFKERCSINPKSKSNGAIVSVSIMIHRGFGWTFLHKWACVLNSDYFNCKTSNFISSTAWM